MREGAPLLQQTVKIPSSDGFEVPVDMYVPAPCAAVDPDIRRPAVIICPGGGYDHLSERESEPVALRFLSGGFNAFVVRYRVAPSRFPAQLFDLACAVAYVRANADALHTDRNRIAVMGFSAGGHLAGCLGVLWHKAALFEKLHLTPEEIKPNALALCYAVITAGEYANRGTFETLTGQENPAFHEALSVEKFVDEHCPPTFLWHSFEDSCVPVQNSLLMANALANHHIPAQMHLYPFGPHGAALCNEQTSGVKNPHFFLPDCAGWPELAMDFFKKVMPEKYTA